MNLKSLIHKSIILIILIVSSTALAATDLQMYEKSGHKSATWTPLVEAGFSAYDSGNLEAGVGFFQRAFDKGCRDGLVYYRSAQYLEGGGKFEQAIKYYEMAEKDIYKRYPKSDAARTINEDLGRLYFKIGDLGKAKAKLMRALVTKGDTFTANFLLGSIAQKENDYEAIITFYSKALLMPAPEGTNATNIALTLMVEVGRAYYELKQYDRSLEIWNKILESFPGHPIAQRYKQALQQQQKNSGPNSMSEQEKRILENY